METPFTIDRRPATQYSAESAVVDVILPGGGAAHVTAYGPEDRPGYSAPATVIWSAIGSVSAEDALAYAGAIALAASIAPTLAPATGKAEVA